MELWIEWSLFLLSHTQYIPIALKTMTIYKEEYSCRIARGAYQEVDDK